MCEPTTIALGSLALSVGSEALRAKGTSNARKEGKYHANEAYRATLADINARMAEEQRATGVAIDRAGVQTDAAVGSATAAAAASGVGGRSIDLMLRSLEQEEANYIASAEDNLTAVEAQLGRQKEQAAVAKEASIVQLPTYNPLLGGLRIGSAALDAGRYLHERPRAPRSTEPDPKG